MGRGRGDAPLFEVRPSAVHGFGGFALRLIRRGTRIAEYVDERLTEAEVGARSADKAAERGHAFLFHMGDDAYIDASRHGNDSRFIITRAIPTNLTKSTPPGTSARAHRCCRSVSFILSTCAVARRRCGSSRSRRRVRDSPRALAWLR